MRANHHLGFFYFSFSDTTRQSTEVFIRSILRQLLLQRETLPDGVVNIWRMHGHTSPALGIWKDALRETVKGNRETFVLVDALDECPLHSGERLKLLRFLEEVVNMKLYNLHLLATSRRESDVERMLGRLGDIPPFSIQNAEVDQDILSYVEGEINQDEVMKLWPATLKFEVERELGSKAHGM
jgi:hypothetical protein